LGYSLDYKWKYPMGFMRDNQIMSQPPLEYL